jgi:hypothetical protein
VRWFIQQALEHLNEPDLAIAPLTPASVLRAMEVLEQIGAPEARQALEELAKGPADSPLVRQAKAALGRPAK